MSVSLSARRWGRGRRILRHDAGPRSAGLPGTRRPRGLVTSLLAFLPSAPTSPLPPSCLPPCFSHQLPLPLSTPPPPPPHTHTPFFAHFSCGCKTLLIRQLFSRIFSQREDRFNARGVRVTLSSIAQRHRPGSCLQASRSSSPSPLYCSSLFLVSSKGF
jgi:hypothetical protein